MCLETRYFSNVIFWAPGRPENRTCPSNPSVRKLVVQSIARCPVFGDPSHVIRPRFKRNDVFSGLCWKPWVQCDNSQNFDFVIRIASAVAYVTLKISSNAFGLKLTISLISDGLPLIKHSKKYHTTLFVFYQIRIACLYKININVCTHLDDPLLKTQILYSTIFHKIHILSSWKKLNWTNWI